MARFKKRSKSRTRVVRASPMKSYRRTKRYSSGENLTQVVLASAIYGGVREKVSNLLSPFTSRVPLGSVSDEVILGLIHWYGAKKVNNKMLKSVFKAGLIVESARIGEAVADGTLMGNNNAVSTQQNIF